MCICTDCTPLKRNIDLSIRHETLQYVKIMIPINFCIYYINWINARKVLGKYAKNKYMYIRTNNY